MRLRAVIRIFSRRAASIVLLLVLGLLGGAATLLTATPRYDAAATVLLVVRPAATPYEALSGSVYATTRITSYAEVARTPAVLTPVILQLGLEVTPDELAARVATEVDTKGLTIEIVGSSRFAIEAAEIANAVALQLGQVVEQQLDRYSTTNGSVLEVRVIRAATPPLVAAYPLPLPSLLLGLAAGALMALGITLLREVGERSVRTVAELGELSSIPVLGRVSLDPSHDGVSPLLDSPKGARHAREFEMLHTALRWSRFEARRRSLLVTAPDRLAGSTSVAVGLAMTSARAGARTILVDANLENPSIAASLGFSPVCGITDVVVRGYDYTEFVHAVPGAPGLWFVGAGDPVPNAHDILASSRFARLVAQLERDFDEVIIDTVPVGEHLQASSLAATVGGAILVVGMGTSTQEHIARALRALRTVDVPLAGVVVNRVRSRGRDEGQAVHRLERQVAG